MKAKKEARVKSLSEYIGKQSVYELRITIGPRWLRNVHNVPADGKLQEA